MNHTKPKYLAASAAALLVTAFVLVQPAMQSAYAVSALAENQVPAYDDCTWRGGFEDPISMNTVRSGHTVKTIHAEKELFDCFLAQGNLPVIVDLTTYLELYENITSKELLGTNAFSTTCIKDADTATLIDCKSEPADTTPVFLGPNCSENTDITHPQEMNTVNKGNKAKTIDAQKEVFDCTLDDGTLKKVDIVLFSETFENLGARTTDDTQFTSARCVVMISDSDSTSTEGDTQDAQVESCVFTDVPN